MKYIKKNYAGYGLTVSVILLIGVNFYQYVNTFNNYPIVFEYGFPFVWYEYLVTLSRGRILWLGILGNIFFTIVVGFLIGFVINLTVKNSNDLK